MSITPLEIRQKSFEKKLRGYDKDEVSAFLVSLSNEWERVLDENKELKIRLEQVEKEARKLREVESSLFKTLKTAEDTGANLIDQANKAAELHLKETEMNAEAIMSESKYKSKTIIEQAEQQAKELISEMQDAIKDLEKNYQTIENQRDTLVTELQNIAEDISDRINRTNKQHKKFKVEDHLIKVKQMVRASEARINQEELTVVIPKSSGIPTADSSHRDGAKELDEFIKAKQKKSEIKQKESKEEEGVVEEGNKSFFDQIDN